MADEQEKHRAYDEPIREVKRGYFSLSVFAATGGIGPSATTATCFLVNRAMEYYSQEIFVLVAMFFTVYGIIGLDLDPTPSRVNLACSNSGGSAVQYF